VAAFSHPPIHQFHPPKGHFILLALGGFEILLTHSPFPKGHFKFAIASWAEWREFCKRNNWAD